MSDKTANSLFMLSPLTSKYAGFYQQLLKGLCDYQQLGNKLIQLAENAHAFRQFDQVREIGLTLSNLPIKNYQAIGHYFLAVATNSSGKGDQDKARELFELVVDNAPQHYKAKALLSLAALSAHKADFDSELRYIVEGLKTSPSLAITVSAHRGIAIVKAKEGYHKQSLKDLEQIQPLIKLAPPLIYFDYLNSYAVELGEAGRLYEARNICNLVLVSPFAFAYPEWLETAQDLKAANRSFVVPRPKRIRKAKLLQMPKIELGEPSETEYPASVVNLQDWKSNMGKKKNGGKNLEGLDSRQLLLKLMELGTARGMTDDKLYRVIVMMEKILREPDKPQEPEDDDPGA